MTLVFQISQTASEADDRLKSVVNESIGNVSIPSYCLSAVIVLLLSVASVNLSVMPSGYRFILTAAVTSVLCGEKKLFKCRLNVFRNCMRCSGGNVKLCASFFVVGRRKQCYTVC